jgi:hypothetical protein
MKGTCLEYSFRFRDSADWQGVYHLLGGDSWGMRPGINLQDLLGLGPKSSVVLKFRAWGESGGEVVTFQCGGVNTGPHRSSLRFPQTTSPDPIRLSQAPREFSIHLKANQVTNIIDPFCVVVRALDNKNKAGITLFVDAIRFETAGEQD